MHQVYISAWMLMESFVHRHRCASMQRPYSKYMHMLQLFGASVIGWANYINMLHAHHPLLLLAAWCIH